MTLIWDGVAPFTADDPEDPTVDQTTTPATNNPWTNTTGTHTPGQDESRQNYVVRTYDQYAYRIDWNVNERDTENAVLTVTLDSYDAVTNDIAWNPDQTGMFTGCDDTSTISADGLTLTCVLGPQTQGSHGTIKPIVQLGTGIDMTELTASVAMTDAEDSVVATASPHPAYVSEAPAGNWIKGGPVVSDTVTVGGEEGHVVIFPLSLRNTGAPQLTGQPKGSGNIDPSADISFFDHFWNSPNNTALASTDQMLAAGVEGSVCGPLDPDNGVLLPQASPDADWTGSCTSDLGGTYPVWQINIAGGSYSEVPVDDAGTVITGQLVVWMTTADIAEAQGSAASVTFDNLIGSNPADEVITDPEQATPISPIDVSGNNGFVGSETTTVDNVSDLSFGSSGGGGDSGTDAYTTHWAAMTSDYYQTRYTGGHNHLTWSEAHTSIASSSHNFHVPLEETATLDPNDADPWAYLNTFDRWRTNPWTGKGIVSRGQAVNMQLFVGERSTSTDIDTPVQGCMTWNAAQIKLQAMPDYNYRLYHGNSSGVGWTYGSDSANGTLQDFYVGSIADPVWGTGTAPIDPYDEALMAELGMSVHIEYALDPDVNANQLTADKENATVLQNNVECNDTNPVTGTDRQWVDSAAVSPLGDGLYHYNMVRVRIEGSYPWQNVQQVAGHTEQNPSGNAATSGFFLNVSGVVGTDQFINHDDKSLYLHSSRAIGEFVDGKPTTENCTVMTQPSNNDYGDGEQTRSLNIAVDGDPTTVPSYRGWCNLGYHEDNELEQPTTQQRSTLDLGASTFPNDASASGAMSSNWEGDFDHDRITIKSVRPGIIKTNDAGAFDITDNGGLVTYTMKLSAIGAPIEALTNVQFTDTLPEQYRFVSIDQYPSTPGAAATCTTPAVGETGTIQCQLSEPDPTQDTGDLPAGLVGNVWTDEIRITVRVEGGVAADLSYNGIANTAHLTSTGGGPWDGGLNNGAGGFATDGVLWTSDPMQDAQSTAYSYLPLSSDRGAIVKTIDPEQGECTFQPGADLTGDALTAWQERCSMIGFDDVDSNAPLTDGDGNVHFTLNYTNLGNTRLSGMTFVDVLPNNNDGDTEPESATTAQNLTPATIGDARTPGSSFSGDLGLVSISGADRYYVTADPAIDVSRDPLVTFTGDNTGGNTWCEWDEGTQTAGAVVSGPGTECPQTAFGVTAVYIVAQAVADPTASPPVAAERLLPGETKTVTMTLDTENAQCDDLYTNTFGGRVDQIGLPIRSNDVSAMVECPPYSLGNQVWFDANNNGTIDDGEDVIGGVVVELYTDLDGDGQPDDTNGDGVIDSDDAIATDTTDDDGLYLFENLKPGDYIVGIPASNFAEGGALEGTRSSDPTEADPNADVDNNDNGIVDGGQVWSGVVTLGQQAEPTGEDPTNDTNEDNRSNLTVDFGFYTPNFDLALRKTLAEGQAELVQIGDLVTFDITVFNQGDVIGDDIQVTDYIPAQLALADEDWTAVGDDQATIQVPGPLAPDGSTVVQITLEVVSGGLIDNFAEISEQTPVDESGETVTYVTGEPIVDVDSVPDQDNTNDELIDDEIDLTPATGDEDDHDIASIYTPPVIDIEKWNTNEGPVDGDHDTDSYLAAADEDVEVTFTITNTGQEALTDVVVSDSTTNGPAITGLTCDFSTLGGPETGTEWAGPFAIGDSFDCVGTLPAMGWSAEHSNTATVTGVGETSGVPVTDEDDWNAETPPVFDLALRKTLAEGQGDLVQLGDTVTFDIEVFNQGEVDATDIQVTDYIPEQLALADEDWTAAGDGLATIQIPGTLAAGESTVVQITFTVVLGGTIDNFAEISEQTPVDENGDVITDREGEPIVDVDSVPDQEDTDVLIDDEIDLTPATGDEDDHDIASVHTPPVIDIEKWNTNEGLVPGDHDRDYYEAASEEDVEVSFTITNSGSEALTDIVVSDKTTDGPDMTGLTCDFSALGGPSTGLEWDGPFEVGDSFDCVATLPAMGYNEQHSDTARVTGIGAETGIPVVDEDDWNGKTPPVFDLALRKTLAAGQSPQVQIGDKATFAITVFNQGDVAATDIEVTDYIPSQLKLADDDWTAVGTDQATIRIPGTLQPGDSIQVPITFEVLTGGTIDNFAEISAQTPIDENGNPLDLVDIDSIPDQDNGNDKLIDDEINKTPATGDEDDHDIASIYTPLAVTGGVLNVALPLGIAGVLLLLGLGALRMHRRRQEA
ncbi:SdrD B-like domain-containing protein [Microbacterium sp.]|uniref:SdrD B-like domain-containing protein n=1 Tax=Microbacterium sp. TaxID=51671 RepID=UPI003A8830A4